MIDAGKTLDDLTAEECAALLRAHEIGGRLAPYYLIQIAHDGTATVLGPFETEAAQASEARRRMADGEMVLTLDVDHLAQRAPVVGRVTLTRFEPTLQRVLVEVLCGKPVDGGRCCLPRHGNECECSPYVGP